MRTEHTANLALVPAPRRDRRPAGALARLAAVFASCAILASLSGCFFVYIPASLLQRVVDGPKRPPSSPAPTPTPTPETTGDPK